MTRKRKATSMDENATTTTTTANSTAASTPTTTANTSRLKPAAKRIIRSQAVDATAVVHAKDADSATAAAAPPTQPQRKKKAARTNASTSPNADLKGRAKNRRSNGKPGERLNDFLEHWAKTRSKDSYLGEQEQEHAVGGGAEPNTKTAQSQQKKKASKKRSTAVVSTSPPATASTAVTTITSESAAVTTSRNANGLQPVLPSTHSSDASGVVSSRCKQRKHKRATTDSNSDGRAASALMEKDTSRLCKIPRGHRSFRRHRSSISDIESESESDSESDGSERIDYLVRRDSSASSQKHRYVRRSTKERRAVTALRREFKSLRSLVLDRLPVKTPLFVPSDHPSHNECSPQVFEEILRLKSTVESIVGHEKMAGLANNESPFQMLQVTNSALRSLQAHLTKPQDVQQLAFHSRTALEHLWTDGVQRANDEFRCKTAFWRHKAMEVREALRVAIASVEAKRTGALPALENALNFTNSFGVMDAMSDTIGTSTLKDSVMMRAIDGLRIAIDEVTRERLNSLDIQDPPNQAETASVDQTQVVHLQAELKSPPASHADSCSAASEETETDEDPLITMVISGGEQTFPVRGEIKDDEANTEITTQNNAAVMEPPTSLAALVDAIAITNALDVEPVPATTVNDSRASDSQDTLTESGISPQTPSASPAELLPVIELQLQQASSPVARPMNENSIRGATPITNEENTSITYERAEDSAGNQTLPVNTSTTDATIDTAPPISTADSNSFPNSPSFSQAQHSNQSSVSLPNESKRTVPDEVTITESAASTPNSASLASSTASQTQEGEESSASNNASTEVLGCIICRQNTFHSDLLICDNDCGREFHKFCLTPPLHTIPEDDWYCPRCLEEEHIEKGNAIYRCSVSTCKKITCTKYCSEHRCICEGCVNRCNHKRGMCQRHERRRKNIPIRRKTSQRVDLSRERTEAPDQLDKSMETLGLWLPSNTASLFESTQE